MSVDLKVFSLISKQAMTSAPSTELKSTPGTACLTINTKLSYWYYCSNIQVMTPRCLPALGKNIRETPGSHDLGEVRPLRVSEVIRAETLATRGISSLKDSLLFGSPMSFFL